MYFSVMRALDSPYDIIIFVLFFIECKYFFILVLLVVLVVPNKGKWHSCGKQGAGEWNQSKSKRDCETEHNAHDTRDYQNNKASLNSETKTRKQRQNRINTGDLTETQTRYGVHEGTGKNLRITDKENYEYGIRMKTTYSNWKLKQSQTENIKPKLRVQNRKCLVQNQGSWKLVQLTEIFCHEKL